jgi:SARP family transcriptional regulator, regulator of embCAB operon
MPQYSIRMMGSLSVETDDRRLGTRDLGGRKPKQALEMLLLGRGRYVSKDRLAEMLWGDTLPGSAAGTLEHYVSVLRRSLQGRSGRRGSPIVTEHGGYRIDTDLVSVDLFEFERLVADPAIRRSRPRMTDALSLLRGPLLEDEPYATWVEADRTRVQERRQRLLVECAEAALTDGALAESLSLARQAVLDDPLCERAYRTVVRAHYAAGDQVAALASFRECRDVLDRELGVAPMPETEAVHRAVLRRVAVAEVLAAGRSPGSPEVDALAVPPDLAVPAGAGDRPPTGMEPAAGEQRILLRRLRRRGPQHLRVAAASAVLGPPCSPEHVAAALSSSALEVVEVQESLCDMRILQACEAGFTFRCPIVQETLASTVSPARRRLICSVGGVQVA